MDASISGICGKDLARVARGIVRELVEKIETTPTVGAIKVVVETARVLGARLAQVVDGQINVPDSQYLFSAHREKEEIYVVPFQYGPGGSYLGYILSSEKPAVWDSFDVFMPGENGFKLTRVRVIKEPRVVKGKAIEQLSDLEPQLPFLAQPNYSINLFDYLYNITPGGEPVEKLDPLKELDLQQVSEILSKERKGTIHLAMQAMNNLLVSTARIWLAGKSEERIAGDSSVSILWGEGGGIKEVKIQVVQDPENSKTKYVMTFRSGGGGRAFSMYIFDTLEEVSPNQMPPSPPEWVLNLIEELLLLPPASMRIAIDDGKALPVLSVSEMLPYELGRLDRRPAQVDALRDLHEVLKILYHGHWPEPDKKPTST